MQGLSRLLFNLYEQHIMQRFGPIESTSFGDS